MASRGTGRAEPRAKGTRGAQPGEGARITGAAHFGIGTRAEDLHETLARDRRRYERLVYGRLRGGICWQDAEDIVSDALMRALVSAEADPPHLGKEQAWFTRIVFNRGVDFLRARDGRRREGSRPRPNLVSLDELEAAGVELSDDIESGGTAETWIEALDRDRERTHARQIVERVLSQLPSEDAELVKLRHLLGADASRDDVAAMAGLTLGEFRWRYARAWKRFVEAISAEEPTQRCREIRALIGELHAASPPRDAAAQIDAHVLDCPSCRVFARDSYRVLEILPFLPAVGFAERWTARTAALWDRFGPEATTAGGAAGTGAAGAAVAGGAAGTLKTLAVLCSTAVAAGVCVDVLPSRDRSARPQTPAHDETKSPRANATVTNTVNQRATSPPARSPTIYRQATTVASPESAIPASAPSGSREFDPSGSGTRLEPAPAPSTGGGEFGP